jgi:hypothetical protein
MNIDSIISFPINKAGHHKDSSKIETNDQMKRKNLLRKMLGSDECERK